MSDRRVIRFFVAPGHDWPLWESSTPTRESDYTMTPDDYGLSPGLAARLRVWHDVWEERRMVAGAWGDPDDMVAWVREGKTLAWDVRHEVAAFADVSTELTDVRDLRGHRGSPYRR
ncbi:hypothetical protein [Microbacterium sp. W4I20]|uniref:hypothetical protein n=1 Tax=Microbacterium sp. W4I20 TaxID=3042262 RepID=UPI0027881F7A|nr:hypothetical protein [Microbacterium sp. W4I20]MDQ0726048.1 hypothetical protein [Microbacterium sp. W4I20]